MHRPLWGSGIEHPCQTLTRASRKTGVDREGPSSTGFQREPLHITQHSQIQPPPLRIPWQKDEYLQVVGTQCALAGISDTIGTADGIVDHRAGHQLSAVLQRGSSVLAAVELGNKDGKSSGTGSALCKGAQTQPPCLCLCLLGSAIGQIMVIY